MRRLKRKSIKRFKRFKPQAFQASSFKADPDFRQDDGYVTVTGIILSASGRIKLKSKVKELLTFDLQF